MSKYQYEYIDGQRVELNVARWFKHLRAGFRKAFPGLDLKIRSGTRTEVEHEALFRARYVLPNAIYGRRVYDTRWWNGRLWYRISPAGTVATPKTSNHEENGPNGPRSLDVYDTGKDAGVITRGTARDLWMERNAGKSKFENEGYKFKEAWHKTFRGIIGVYPNPAPAGGGSVTVITDAVQGGTMETIRVDNKHQYEIGQEFIQHFDKVGTADTTRKVMSAKDELHDISKAQFLQLLAGLGIPQSAIDWSTGLVIPPEVGRGVEGGCWSRNRQILAILQK